MWSDITIVVFTYLQNNIHTIDVVATVEQDEHEGLESPVWVRHPGPLSMSVDPYLCQHMVYPKV